MKTTELITLEKQDVFFLADELKKYLSDQMEENEFEWLTSDEVMKYLGIRQSTLAKIRNNDEVIFSQISRKHILYKRSSVLEYLEKNVVQ